MYNIIVKERERNSIKQESIYMKKAEKKELNERFNKFFNIDKFNECFEEIEKIIKKIKY